jgi:phosphoinositide-3-kinase, regulatory subunit 4
MHFVHWYSYITVAECALVFLELAEQLKTKTPNVELDLDNVFYHISYDSNLRELQETIQEDVIVLLTDPSAFVKKALLEEIARMCVFFGRQVTR